MTAEHDNASGEAVGPGDHPAGGPAAGAQSQGPGAPPAHGAQPQVPATPASGNGDPGAGVADDPALRTAETAAEGPPSETEPAPEDHERQLERDLEELSAKAEKADEYLELARRTKADFENYRKRAAREAAAAQDRGIAKLAKELLPAVDNLDRAVQAALSAGENLGAAAGNGTDTLVSGIKLVHADVLAALQRAGIERYSPQGELFDPQRHEAIAQQPIDGAQPGTIVEVYQQGYLLGETVIRPARVVVAG
ncbi:MAG: molecular chaperone GrpE [Solirubrobacteraceae bacterium]|nr:molecular chaperone GrpE [Solirubrobacteraceae bacterium]